MTKGKRQNTLYVMEAKLYKGDINTARRDVSIELWHTRLYNICEKGLQTLDRNKFLPNFQGMPLKTCDNCLVGKAHRVSFHTYPPSRKSNVIDLIYNDVCTMQTRTVGGALYFVNFIDDHSRKVWGFALKTKY